MNKWKILVVDDSATIRTKVSRVLTGAGYEVATAKNGLAAVRKLVENPPFLAIVDIAMPIMDGFGVSYEMKRMGIPWDRIPIVFLTTDESQASKKLGHEYGAYLQKPAKDAELLELVDSFRQMVLEHRNTPIRHHVATPMA